MTKTNQSFNDSKLWPKQTKFTLSQNYGQKKQNLHWVKAMTKRNKINTETKLWQKNYKMYIEAKLWQKETQLTLKQR